MRGKKLILIGPHGIDKLLISNVLQDQGLIVLDFPVIGDYKHCSNYQKEKISKVFPIDGFVLLKLNAEESTKSPDMLKIANDFIDLFGALAVKSLLIVCVQTDSCQTSFKNKIETSEWYKKLKTINKDQIIDIFQWNLMKSNFVYSNFFII
jgi:hypothetical protein